MTWLPHSRPGGKLPPAQALRPAAADGPVAGHDPPAADKREPAAAAQSPWAPIAVGRPVASFASRPALFDSYRPDTVADGWDTPDFAVRLASVRGYAHRYNGNPRQDEAIAAAHRPTGAVVIAVADGVSAAEMSHVGARLACRTAVEAALAALGTSPCHPQWTRVVEGVADRLVERASGPDGPTGVADAERRYGTTLVLGTVLPGPDGADVSLARVGDSGAWLLHDGQYADVLPGKGSADGEVVTAAVFALPRVPDQVHTVELRLPADAVLLIGTDGFGDPLGDGSGAVGDLFRELAAGPVPALRLAHLVDFSRETFDDDRTLVAVWPQARTGRIS